MEILSCKGNLTCEQINYVKVAQGSISKELHNHYSFKIQSFEYIRVGLKGPKTCTYLRKWLHASSLSKICKKKRATMVICLVVCPRELAWYLVLLGHYLKILGNYKVTITQ